MDDNTNTTQRTLATTVVHRRKGERHGPFAHSQTDRCRSHIPFQSSEDTVDHVKLRVRCPVHVNGHTKIPVIDAIVLSSAYLIILHTY
jgi:hypothetical protein